MKIKKVSVGQNAFDSQYQSSSKLKPSSDLRQLTIYADKNDFTVFCYRQLCLLTSVHTSENLTAMMRI